MEIIQTKDLSLLGTGKNLNEVWEGIIKKNGEVNSDVTFENYVYTYKQYNKIYREYLIVKAAIVVLLAKVDKDLIAYLATIGYKIDYSSEEKYDASLIELGRKADNLTSKIKTKANEIVMMNTGESKGQSFDEVMALLNWSWPNNVPDDITLKRYNEYKKVLKAQAKKK